MTCPETVTVNVKAVNWLKEHYPALCIKAGLCERIAGRLYTKIYTTPPAAPVQEPNEADELLRHLGLEPQTYRTDGGAINRLKVKAALAHPDEYPRMASMDAMVSRFLTWPVPASVYPDGTPGQPGRTGTNLLNASEARQMLEHVLTTPPAAPTTGETK